MTRRARAALLTTAMTAILAAAATTPAEASTEPPATEPAGSETPAATTEPAGTYEFGMFTAPDGSFTAMFSEAPGRTADAASGIVTYLSGLDEDTQSVVLFPPGALGATAESTAAERAALFLAASGTDIEHLANTPTNFGPFPASHFAARLTLGDGHRATVYGVIVDRGTDVAYAFHTDIGDDDNAAAIAFVQSFSIVLPEPPVPTTTTTTLAPTTVGSTSAAPTSAAPTDPGASATSAAPTSTTTPPPSTVVAAPGGAVLGFDGRWWVAYPDGVTPSFRASTEDGFAYAEYLAIDGDDTLIVRVTEVPAGFEWVAELVPDAAAERVGGTVTASEPADVDDQPAVRFTVAQDDSDTSGDTVEALVVDGGDQIYTVQYWDGGVSSPDFATEFIESFGLA